MSESPELPPEVHEDPEPGELADDTDDLDWSIERDGRMRDHADAPVPATETWEG